MATARDNLQIPDSALIYVEKINSISAMMKQYYDPASYPGYLSSRTHKKHGDRFMLQSVVIPKTALSRYRLNY